MSEGYAFLERQEFGPALVYFDTVLKEHPENKTALICYGRALGLGGDSSEALSFFKQLDQKFNGDKEVLLNLAEAYLWNKSYDEARQVYKNILEESPNDFVANFGYANSFAGLQRNEYAIKYINKALKIQPENHGAHNSRMYILIAYAYELFKQGAFEKSKKILSIVDRDYPNTPQVKDIQNQIKSNLAPRLMVNHQSRNDSGGNKTLSEELLAQFSIGGSHRFFMNLGMHQILGKSSSASKKEVIIKDVIKLDKIHQLQLGFGLANFKSPENTKNRITQQVALESFWSPRLYSKLKYFNEIQQYTVQLLERDIFMHNLSLATNLNLFKGLGFYTEGVLTRQSDINHRKLIYSSLYYTLANEPLIRIGLNYNNISYSRQTTYYFSPSSFQSYEAFILLDGFDTSSKFKYKISTAFGLQDIESNKLQATARIEAAFQYDITSQLFIHTNYTFSNSAQSTALGSFSVNTFNLGVGYIFHKK